MSGTAFAEHLANTPSDDLPTVVDGACSENSAVSEGPIDADLTKRRSRYFCDTAVIAWVGASGRRMMIQFAERGRTTSSVLAFAGRLEGDVLDVDAVYMVPERRVDPVGGSCKIYFGKKPGEPEVQAIVCGARVEERGRATVPIITFRATGATIP